MPGFGSKGRNHPPGRWTNFRRGNLLTEPGRPTMVLRESQMKDALQTRATLAALKRHRWICFFLAFFLLYNPFHALPHGRNTLEVCHPASYRATVGASELQTFTPAAGWDSLPTLDFVEVEASASQPVVATETSIVEPRLVNPSLQFLGSSLWFRPPPAL